MTAPDELSSRINGILGSASQHAARSVNSAQVLANWLIGREIVGEQQEGMERAVYGEKVIPELAKKLKASDIKGYSATNLRLCRQFHLEYPDLLDGQISHSLRDQFRLQPILHTLRGESSLAPNPIHHTPCDESPKDPNVNDLRIHHTPCDQFKPGHFTPNISWSHYRFFLKASSPEARSFYEIETLRHSWSARELDRQINSLLYERLAKSRDKDGLIRLANEGHRPQLPAEIFKDPLVIEFLGLPESEKLVESDLESALTTRLQSFLLELGSGFAFLARQQRLTLEGDHFYVDLVFYHTILKCHVLVDLKIGKLTHEDLGQLQLYVNYYDRERCASDDNPTLGLILATDKNDSMVRYTLAEGQQNIFTSRYQLHLPTEAQLQAEIQRELRQLATTGELPRPAGAKLLTPEN
jgi:predicted nuclease of restriction endonuclease-like (RecB) superfamily